MRTINKLFFSWDSLTIYDGGSITSPMIGTFCGTSIPPSQVSSSNEILINFHSDWAGRESGFKMEYNPTGKQITKIQNNTEYHISGRRILVTFFYFQVSLFFLFGKVIKIT